MKSKLALLASLIGLVPVLANASNSSPYVTGQWNLQDSFKDFTGNDDPIVTNNTAFTFLNPTFKTLTLEYAFFASDGTFCGCDRDTLSPNGRVRYTMLGELQGGQFSRALCPTQNDGEMKSIVFTSEESIGREDALQNGIQIHVDGSDRTESDLNAVPITEKIIREMREINEQCEKFIGGKSKHG